jgi:hypothetical protein
MEKNPKTALSVLVLIVVVILGVSLALHFGQKAHDRLAFSIDQAYPPDQPFVPGEIFARTVVEIMDNELDAPFGWRPNDFILWGPWLWADNNASRQLGIIQGVRDTVRVFRDNLTKISSDEFDRNLLEADTMFRNDAKRLILPSAESQFNKGVQALRRYIDNLHTEPPSARPLNKNKAELIRLFEVWTGLLGDAHANLYRSRNPDGSPVRMWQTDDYFYQAQGTAAVMYYMTSALEREFADKLNSSMVQHFHEVEDALGVAAALKPIIVLDGAPDGITANSRKNLDAYVSEARDKMFSLIEELR